MSTALIQLIVHSAVGKVAETIDIQPGSGAKAQSVRIKAQDGVKYQLKDLSLPGQKAPEVVKLKRVGKDLLIAFEEGVEAADVVLENYYSELFEVPSSLIGEGQSGRLYEYALEASQASQVQSAVTSLIEAPSSVNALLTGAPVSVGSATAVGLAAFNLPALGISTLGVAAVSESVVIDQDTSAAEKLAALVNEAKEAGQALGAAQETFEQAEATLEAAIAALGTPATPEQLAAAEAAQEALTQAAADLQEAADTANAAVDAANAAATGAKEADASLATITAAAAAATTAAKDAAATAAATAAASEAATDAKVDALIATANDAGQALGEAQQGFDEVAATLEAAIAALDTPATPEQLAAAEAAQEALTKAAAELQAKADAAQAAVDVANAAATAAKEADTGLAAITAAAAAATTAANEAADTTAASEAATDAKVAALIAAATGAGQALGTAQDAFDAAETTLEAAIAALGTPATAEQLAAAEAAQEALTAAAADLQAKAAAAVEATTAALDAAKAAKETAPDFAGIDAAVKAATVAADSAAATATDSEAATDAKVAALIAAANTAGQALGTAQAAFDAAEATLQAAIAALGTPATPEQLAAAEAAQEALTAAATDLQAKADAATAATTAALAGAAAAQETAPDFAAIDAAVTAATTAATEAADTTADSEAATDAKVAALIATANEAGQALETAQETFDEAEATLEAAIAALGTPATAEQLAAAEAAQEALTAAAADLQAKAEAANAAVDAANAAATAAKEGDTGLAAITAAAAAATTAATEADDTTAASEAATDAKVAALVDAANEAGQALATAQTAFDEAEATLEAAIAALGTPATTEQLAAAEAAQEALTAAASDLQAKADAATAATTAALAAAEAAKEAAPDFAAIDAAVTAATTAATEAADTTAASEAATDAKVAALIATANEAGQALGESQEAFDEAEATLAAKLHDLGTPVTPEQLAAAEAAQEALTAAAADLQAKADAANAAVKAANEAATAAKEAATDFAAIDAAVVAATADATGAATTTADSEANTDAKVADLIATANDAGQALETAQETFDEAETALADAIAALDTPATAEQLAAAEAAQEALTAAATDLQAKADAATAATTAALDAAEAAKEAATDFAAIDAAVVAATADAAGAATTTTDSEAITDAKVAALVVIAEEAGQALETAQEAFDEAETALADAIAALDTPATTEQLAAAEAAQEALTAAAADLQAKADAATAATTAALDAAEAAQETAPVFTAIDAAVTAATTAAKDAAATAAASEAATDAKVAALIATANEAGQALETAQETFDEAEATLEAAIAALGTPATAEQLAAAEAAQEALTAAAADLQAKAEAANAAVDAANAAATAAKEGDTGLAAITAAAAAATTAATEADDTTAASEAATDAKVAALVEAANEAGQALATAQTAFDEAETALADAIAALDTPATAEQLAAAEAAQEALTQAAADLQAKADAATAATTAALAAAEAAKEAAPVFAAIDSAVTAATTAATEAADTTADSEAATDAKVAALIATANEAGQALGESQEAFDEAEATLEAAIADLGTPATAEQLAAAEAAQEALTAAAADLQAKADAANAAVKAANEAATAAKEAATDFAAIDAAVVAATADATGAATTTADSEANTDGKVADLIATANDAGQALETAQEAFDEAETALADAIAALDTPATAEQLAAAEAAQEALTAAATDLQAKADAATAATTAALDAAEAAKEAATDFAAIDAAVVAATADAAGAATTTADSEAITDGKVADLIATANDAGQALETAQEAFDEAEATLAAKITALSTPATVEELAAAEAAQEALTQAAADLQTAVTAATASKTAALAAAEAADEEAPDFGTLNTAITAAQADVDGTAAQTTDSEAATDAKVAALVTAANTANTALAAAQGEFDTAEQALVDALAAMDSPAQPAQITAVQTAQSALSQAAADLQSAAAAAQSAMDAAVAAAAAANEDAPVFTNTAIADDISAAEADVSAAPATLASATIETFAQSNGTNTGPVAGDYADLGVVGMGEAGQPSVAMVNSALADADITGANANSPASVQDIVDAYAVIVANANAADSTAAAAVTNASQADYAAIGVNGVDSAPELGLLGDVIDAKAVADIDTVPKIQALADAVQAVMNGDASLAQLELLGVEGVTTETLALVQAGLASAADATELNTFSGLQAVITGVLDKYTAAADKIAAYAGSDGSTEAPTAQDYADLGVMGVGAAGQPTVAMVNSALADADTTGTDADSRTDVQAIVDGYAAIVANADAADSTAAGAVPNASEADYAAIGVNGVDSAPELGLLGDVIDAKAVADIDTVPKIQALADAVQAVMDGDASLAQLELLGVEGVTTENIALVQAGLASAADATELNTLSGLQDVVTAVLNKVTAAADKIAAYADSNGITDAPTAQDYADLGVMRMGAAGQPTVAMVNSALADADTSGAEADSRTDVQAIVDGYAAIVANADEADSTAAAGLPNASEADYAAIGVNGVDSAPELSLLGDVIDAKAVADIDTVPKIQALADAVQAVMDGDASLAQLELLGVEGVTTENIALVQAGLASASDATELNTLSGLQTVVTAVLDNYTAAADKIAAYAESNGGTDAPTTDDYADLGVVGIGAAGQPSVAMVNSALADADITGADANSQASVQDIVDAYAVIVANADAADSTAAAAVPNASETDYAAIGVNSVDSAPELGLLGDLIDTQAVADVDTVPKIQALADTVQAIMDLAALTDSTSLEDAQTANPNLLSDLTAQLSALGMTGVNAQNIGSIWAAIRDSADTGADVDSRLKIQALINNANDAPINAVPGALSTIEDTPLVITGLSVSDADVGSSNLTVTLEVSHGTLNVASGADVILEANGSPVVTLTGSVDAINTLLASTDAVTFTPTANTHGTGSLTITTSDEGNTGTGGSLVDVDTVEITVTSVNDGPALDAAIYTAMNDVKQDAPTPVGASAGNAVSDFFMAMTDDDGEAEPRGMAIVSVNDNGTLYYSTDNGATWKASGALSAANALHLDGNSRVYFKPDAGWAGSAGDAFVYHAWDLSNGLAAGDSAPLGSLTPSAAYSLQSASVAITVVATDNTPPVFSSDTAVSVMHGVSGSIYDAQATDAGGDADEGITYSLSGVDQGLFDLNTATGQVSFKTSPDFGAPADAGGDNIYNITLTATDASDNATTHAVAITVDAQAVDITANRISTYVGSQGAVRSNHLVNTSSVGNNESAPVVVKLSGGGSFMAWYERGLEDPAGQVYGRYFDANGQTVGAQLTISTWRVNGDDWTISMPSLTAVALADNQVALGWQTVNGTAQGGPTATTEVAYALTSLTGSTASVSKAQALANTMQTDNQSAPLMVKTSDGGFFMAWFNNADNADPAGTVTGRYFNADGTARTAEFNVSGTNQVNANTWVNDSQPPLVAVALADGKVAVAWVSDETTLMTGGVGPDIAHVVVGYTDATGSAGAVQRGNNTAAGNQGPPVITATGDGGYFMAWYSNDYQLNQGPLRGQYFDANGAPVGAEQALGSWPVYGDDVTDMPDLTVETLDNNTVVVGWQMHDTAGVGTGNTTEAAYILVSRTGTDVTVGTQALMNSTFAGDQSGPAIGLLSNGGFFAAWYDASQADAAGVVRGQYFNAAGVKVGAEVLVSGTQRVEGWDGGEMPSLSVTVLDNDRVDVAWIADNADQSTTDLWGSAVVHTLLEAPYAWTVVSGTATPGATVELFKSGVSQGSQVANASTGAYSFTGLSLPSGTYQLVATLGGASKTTELHIGSGGANSVTTGSAAYAMVEGRQGDDAINLSNGGQATLLYGDLGNNNTGNNGHDTVTGFTVGNVATDANADVINLVGVVLEAGDAQDYVSVVQNGGNSEIWVDRDGVDNSTYASTRLLTLNGVQTDLSTLLNNGQLVLPLNLVMTASRTQTLGGVQAAVLSNGVVSSTTTDESAPVVVKLSGGGTFMAWYTNAELDPAGQVYGRYFDANGQAVGAQLTISTWRVNGNAYSSMPSLTAVALANDQVAVGWQTEDSANLSLSPTASNEVAYALTSLTGSTASVSKVQALANTPQKGDQSAPVMVATDDGGFFMAWFNADDADSSGVVMGRYFNADGTARTAEFNVSGTVQVNGHGWINDSQSPLVATALADGKVAVAWVSDETTLMAGGVGPDIAHVLVEYTGATGSAGAVQRGNNTALGNQGPPVMAATGDGGYFMAWYSSDYTLNQGPLRGQYFDANGTKVGAEQSLGTWGVYGNDIVDMPDLTVEALADNTVVVGWQSAPTAGVGVPNTTEAAYILVSRTGSDVTVGTQALLNTTTAGNQSGPAIGKLSNGGFFAAWYDNALGDPAGVVRGQYFNAAGTKVGAEILVSGTQTIEGWNNFEMPSLSVTVLDNDRVDVAWIAEDIHNADGGDTAVVHTLLEAPYAWTAVSGATMRGAVVELFESGLSVGTQVANASGVYHFTGLGLSSGTHQVVATVGETSITTELHIGSGSSNSITTGEFAYALVEGRQGDDQIDLSLGGQATLLYGDLGHSDTGNNGHDTVTGFTIGDAASDPNADIIDLADLLQGESLPTISGFVEVVASGSDTQVWIDRDAGGSTYAGTLLLTLNGTSTDLQTLITNGQLLVS